ncbi:MAG TPA: CopG family transcriptional regulator [Allocoleopsis sp.]
MRSLKISISLSPDMMTFIEQYKKTAGCQSHSQVIAEALSLLQNRELEKAYQEASQEIDEVWDVTIGDGLNDETW